MQRGRESVGEMAMVVCEGVRVCESGRSVCKVAKGDQLGWAGVLLVGRLLLAWRWNARLETRPTEFSLAAWRGEGRRLRPTTCDRMR
jgi:hypothetical protein